MKSLSSNKKSLEISSNFSSLHRTYDLYQANTYFKKKGTTYSYGFLKEMNQSWNVPSQSFWCKFFLRKQNMGRSIGFQMKYVRHFLFLSLTNVQYVTDFFHEWNKVLTKCHHFPPNNSIYRKKRKKNPCQWKKLENSTGAQCNE